MVRFFICRLFMNKYSDQLYKNSTVFVWAHKGILFLRYTKMAQVTPIRNGGCHKEDRSHKNHNPDPEKWQKINGWLLLVMSVSAYRTPFAIIQTAMNKYPVFISQYCKRTSNTWVSQYQFSEDNFNRRHYWPQEAIPFLFWQAELIT